MRTIRVSGALHRLQVVPEFVDRYTSPGQQVTAAILLPSAEQAPEVQFVSGALVCVQVWASPWWPKSVSSSAIAIR